jgi:hypothetical protein
VISEFPHLSFRGLCRAIRCLSECVFLLESYARRPFINQSTGLLRRFDFEPAGRIDPALFGLIRESCCGRLVGGKVKIRSFDPAMFVLFFFLDYFSSFLRWAGGGGNRCLCLSRRRTPPAGTSSWPLYHPTALPSSCRLLLLFCFFVQRPLCMLNLP